MKGLAGKNVLVTGASSGIGQAIAIRFAREGANVAINYRKDAEGAKQTQKSCEEARGGAAGLWCRAMCRWKSR
jgi:glucose 1-dehydrogenase